MMKPYFVLVLLVSAAPALAPAIVAAPVATVVTGSLNYWWGFGSVVGHCDGVGDGMWASFAQVNSRLLVSLESDTRRATWVASLPDSDCPLQVSIQPGVYVNPCAVLSGQPSAPVVSPADPYFHQYSPGSAWYHKRVDYLDGGHVEYWFAPRYSSDPIMPPRLFQGECASGSAWASWDNYGYLWAAGDPTCTLYVSPGPVCTPPIEPLRQGA